MDKAAVPMPAQGSGQIEQHQVVQIGTGPRPGLADLPVPTEAPERGLHVVLGLVLRRLRERFGIDQTEQDLGLRGGQTVHPPQGDGLSLCHVILSGTRASAPAGGGGGRMCRVVGTQAENCPPFTADTKSAQPSVVKVSAGPCGSLLSRTGTTCVIPSAISMQSPPLVL